MNDLAFHPESQQELRDAARYYERQQAGLGKAFRLRIETALEAITKNPNRFALWRRTAVRVALVRRFPYAIYFLIDDSDCVLIIAISHARQRPGYWQHRLR